MRLAIMQPYLFPYLGYYQLMDQAEVFVLYDDVQYIRRGWINRNRLWVNGGAYTFTLPVKKVHIDTPIYEIELSDFPAWRSNFLKTLQLAYRKADHFSWTFGLINEIMNENRGLLIDLLCYSIEIFKEAFGITSFILTSSRMFQNEHLSGIDRILDICHKLHAHEYLNLPGGRALYDPDVFDSHGIELEYISPGTSLPSGPNLDRKANLSIIDLMMWHGRSGVRRMLRRRSILNAHIEREIDSRGIRYSSVRQIRSV
jgi:hypothetical protein